jgi:uncharacterized protein YdaU (DUF1376 family)
MGILKWYKRDPAAALHGMMGLTLEERGAYNTILDLIYSHDGFIDDDPRQICNWLGGVNLKVWKRLRQRLLDAEKLYLRDGKLRNRRADQEVDIALHRVAIASEAITKRWATYNEIKRLRDRSVIQPTTTKTKLLSFLEARRLNNQKKED